MSDWTSQAAIMQVLQSWQREQERQRLLGEEYARAMQTFEDVRKHLAAEQQLREAVGLRRVIDEFARARAAIYPQRWTRQNMKPLLAWENTRQSLEAALRFLPEFTATHQALAQRISPHLLDRISESVANAPLIADVSVDIDEGSRERGEVVDKVVERLIEVVPAGALDDLVRAEFAPLRLLDAALRDPKSLLTAAPRDFEEVVAAIVEELGLEDVFLTPPTGDGGRDVIGTIRAAGFPLVVALECKRYDPEHPVGVQYARALLGTITHGGFRADRGILVTTSRFTSGAMNFIVTAPQLEGVDFNGLVEWLSDIARRRAR